MTIQDRTRLTDLLHIYTKTDRKTYLFCCKISKNKILEI